MLEQTKNGLVISLIPYLCYTDNANLPLKKIKTILGYINNRFSVQMHFVVLSE